MWVGRRSKDNGNDHTDLKNNSHFFHLDLTIHTILYWYRTENLTWILLLDRNYIKVKIKGYCMDFKVFSKGI